jgi:hypothetical protein
MTKVKVFEKVKDQWVKVICEYESPSTYQSKVMTKVKVFKKKVKLQGQRLDGQGHGIK